MTSISIPIVEVDYGIANRFDDCIEINKNLRDYPNLLNPILEHEFAHTNKNISIQDFKLDFLMPQAIHYKQLFKFMIKHPKSFTQFFPLYWSKRRGIVFDFNMGVMYLIMISVFVGTIYFGGRYL
tara:strand:+ start:9023 stop:9397 length:375 start_codon:yes stop_codon:yes gene_type:complete